MDRNPFPFSHLISSFIAELLFSQSCYRKNRKWVLPLYGGVVDGLIPTAILQICLKKPNLVILCKSPFQLLLFWTFQLVSLITTTLFLQSSVIIVDLNQMGD